MSRVHWFSHILNDEGQGIENAEISIYLAGTSTPAFVYMDEFSTDSSNEVPQVYSDTNGFFEFWLPSLSIDPYYTSDQKFKIAWFKAGIESGFIDYVDVYRPSIPVNESDTNKVKDKCVSNYLANLWESHRSTTNYYVHGIEAINESDEGTTKNKLINNKLAHDWEKHRGLVFDNSGFVDTHVIESTPDNDFPHGIQPINFSVTLSPSGEEYWKVNKLISYHLGKSFNNLVELGITGVDPTSTNSTKNKLVSNFIINDIYTKINDVKKYNLTTVTTGSSGSPYILQEDDSVLHIITTTTPIYIEFPTSLTNSGRVIKIKDGSGNAATNNITIVTEGSETIDGEASTTIKNNYGSQEFYSDGTNWFKMGIDQSQVLIYGE